MTKHGAKVVNQLLDSCLLSFARAGELALKPVLSAVVAGAAPLTYQPEKYSDGELRIGNGKAVRPQGQQPRKDL